MTVNAHKLVTFCLQSSRSHHSAVPPPLNMSKLPTWMGFKLTYMLSVASRKFCVCFWHYSSEFFKHLMALGNVKYNQSCVPVDNTNCEHESWVRSHYENYKIRYTYELKFKNLSYCIDWKHLEYFQPYFFVGGSWNVALKNAFTIVPKWNKHQKRTKLTQYLRTVLCWKI